MARSRGLLDEAQLPAELQPFADALMYTTHVDGEPWSHTPAYFHEVRPGSSCRPSVGNLVELGRV